MGRGNKGQGKQAAPQPASLHTDKLQFATISLGLPPRGRARQTTACGAKPANAVFEVGAVAAQPRLSVVQLANTRPIALLAMVPRPLVLFTAGALSGAIAKSITAPLDRVKILLQVKGALATGAIGEAASSGSLIRSLVAVGKEEGLRGYWKGNLPQVLRVVPYSAAQLYSYEVFKRWFTDEDGRLSVQRRLAAGAAAGMTATIVSVKTAYRQTNQSMQRLPCTSLVFLFRVPSWSYAQRAGVH